MSPTWADRNGQPLPDFSDYDFATIAVDRIVTETIDRLAKTEETQ